MEQRSLSAEELARAVAARHQILFAKWVKREKRLTRAEFDELRPDIGEEQYAKGIAELDQAQGRTGDAVLPGEYLHELKEYAKLYGRSPRQIKRWTRAGREAKPQDMPPLDQPGKMLAWWNRHIKLPPPPILEQFALDEAKGEPGPSGLKAIDISTLDVTEGVALKQARRFLAATAEQLEQAYKEGDDPMIGRLQPRWEKALSAVRLAEDSDRKAAAAAGDLLRKAEVLSALSQLIEIMRNMQSTMSRRIRARFGVLPPEIDAKLDEVIEAERARECAALRRCKYFGAVEEVILELDQAAGVAA